MLSIFSRWKCFLSQNVSSVYKHLPIRKNSLGQSINGVPGYQAVEIVQQPMSACVNFEALGLTSHTCDKNVNEIRIFIAFSLTTASPSISQAFNNYISFLSNSLFKCLISVEFHVTSSTGNSTGSVK